MDVMDVGRQEIGHMGGGRLLVTMTSALVVS